MAVLICTVTLLLKLLVPTGYMIVSEHGHVAIAICSGTVSRPTTIAATGTHGDMADHGRSRDHGKSNDHGKPEMPCAFSGLSAPSLAAVDPVVLATLIAFAMSVGLTGLLAPPPFRRAYLRPPLRGPPAYP